MIKNIAKKLMIDQSQWNSSYLWIIVACIPLLFELPASSVSIWALGLVFGGLIANKHPLRWIALAWIISLFFPQMYFLLLACCGILLKNWKACLYAALLGVVLSMVAIPGAFMNIGTIFITTGLILIIYRSIK